MEPVLQGTQGVFQVFTRLTPPDKALFQIAECLLLSLIYFTCIRRLQTLTKRLPIRWFQAI